ncbi:MAG TPA: flagellar protein FlgN [bacterium]|nr:flagellar protein FlgN [bacterium]HPN29914.1 flagellar protein FlgN [bacterium]
MQKKLEKLTEYLNNELNYYNSLMNYSKEKNKNLIDKNLDEISIITQKEEKLVSKIKEVEVQRINLLKQIAEENKIDFNELNMSKISELSADKKTKKKIIELKESLSDTLENLRKINDMNTELIKQSLDIINQTIKIMGTTAANPQVYNKNKKDHVSKNQQSFLFDKKF